MVFFLFILAFVNEPRFQERSFDTQLPTSVEEWRFEEIVSYGNSEESVLGGAVGGVVEIWGVYYILDNQQRELVKLTADGNFTISSVTGDGPGECYLPVGLTLWPDRKHAAVLNRLPVKLVNNIAGCPKLEASCICPKSWSFQFTGLAQHAMSCPEAGLLALNIGEMHNKQNEICYKTVLFMGTERISSVYEECVDYVPPSERKESLPIPHWWGRSGQMCFLGSSLWLAPKDSYTLYEYSFNGELLGVFNGENYQDRTVTSTESRYFRKETGQLAPAICGIFPMGDRLLVLTSFGVTGDSLRFDCLSFGEQIEMTRIVLPGIEPSPTAEYFWLNDNALAIVYGELGAELGEEEEHVVRIYERKAP